MSLDPLTKDILENHPKLTAEVIRLLSPEEIAALIKNVPAQIGLRMLSPLTQWKCTEIIKILTQKKSIELIQTATIDDATSILRKLPKANYLQLIKHLSNDKKQYIKSVLSYPEDSIGAWMNPVPLTASVDLIIDDVLSLFKNQTSLSDSPILNLHIVDHNHKIKGIIPIAELFLLNPKMRLRKVMNKGYKPLAPYQPLKTVSSYLEWENFSSLPVTDTESVLIGELTQTNLRRGQNTLKPKPQVEEAEIESPLWGSLDTVDIVLDGMLELLPKPSERPKP